MTPVTYGANDKKGMQPGRYAGKLKPTFFHLSQR